MEFDLTRLKNNIEEYINIDRSYSFSDEYLSKTEIIELNDLKIKGYITKDSLDSLLIDLKISGVMVLTCSLTLKPVNYPFETNISGNLEELLEEVEENSKKTQNTLDILPIIWENILMEIPMKVTSEDAHDIKLSGDGWKFVTEDSDIVNPELEKLKDLL